MFKDLSPDSDHGWSFTGDRCRKSSPVENGRAAWGRLVYNHYQIFNGQFSRYLVPVIVVFTKFDLLCDSVQRELYTKDPKSTTLVGDAKKHAQEKLTEELVPFEENIGHKVLHVTVSSML